MTERPRECPTGCGRIVYEGSLLCGACWTACPRELRVRVTETWQDLRDAGGDLLGPEADAFKTACDEAILAVDHATIGD